MRKAISRQPSAISQRGNTSPASSPLPPGEGPGVRAGWREAFRPGNEPLLNTRTQTRKLITTEKRRHGGELRANKELNHGIHGPHGSRGNAKEGHRKLPAVLRDRVSMWDESVERLNDFLAVPLLHDSLFKLAQAAKIGGGPKHSLPRQGLQRIAQGRDQRERTLGFVRASRPTLKGLHMSCTSSLVRVEPLQGTSRVGAIHPGCAPVGRDPGLSRAAPTGHRHRSWPVALSGLSDYATVCIPSFNTSELFRRSVPPYVGRECFDGSLLDVVRSGVASSLTPNRSPGGRGEPELWTGQEARHTSVAETGR